MLVNTRYTGVGQIDNAWSLILVIKHVIVLVMIGIGAYIQREPVLKLKAALITNNETIMQPSFQRLKTMEYLMAGCGMAVLLLTALAEVS